MDNRLVAAILDEHLLCGTFERELLELCLTCLAGAKTVGHLRAVGLDAGLPADEEAASRALLLLRLRLGDQFGTDEELIARLTATRSFHRLFTRYIQGEIGPLQLKQEFRAVRGTPARTRVAAGRHAARPFVRYLLRRLRPADRSARSPARVPRYPGSAEGLLVRTGGLMAVWHEQRTVKGRLMKYSPSRTAAAVVERDEEDPGRFRAYFRRWHPGEGVQRRRGEHGSWYRLVPREPLTGDSSRELLHHAVSLLASVEERTCDSLFRIEIEPAPAKLPVVDDIMHARYRLHATVVQLGPDRFRIRYWGDIKGYPDEGWGFSPQLFPPGDPRREQLWDTFADSIEAARDVAAAEMENILQTTGNRFKLR